MNNYLNSIKQIKYTSYYMNDKGKYINNDELIIDNLNHSYKVTMSNNKANVNENVVNKFINDLFFVKENKVDDVLVIDNIYSEITITYLDGTKEEIDGNNCKGYISICELIDEFIYENNNF